MVVLTISLTCPKLGAEGAKSGAKFKRPFAGLGFLHSCDFYPCRPLPSAYFVPMAKLVPCPTCGEKVSSDAETCPKCGHEFVSNWEHLTTVLVVGILVLFFILKFSLL